MITGRNMNIANRLPIFVGVMLWGASAYGGQISGTAQDKSLPEEALVTVNGVELHYVDWGGSGEVVLLLSGLGNDALIFDGFAQKLTDRWHVIGLTRRGFGKSSKAATGYTTAIRVDDMRQFFEALKIPRAHLIGHSLAGDEMTLFASRYPALVGKLVYLDAAYDRSGSLELGLTDPTSSALNRRLILEAIDSPAAMTVQLPSASALSPDMLKAMVAYVREMNEFRIDFSKVQAPILALYVVSDHHPNTPPKADKDDRRRMDTWWIEHFSPWQRARIQDFRRQQPKAHVIEMKNANHFLFLGKAQDDTLRHTRDFLAR
jgi:pimeloyl-ACP methyl ester carboxylesterase